MLRKKNFLIIVFLCIFLFLLILNLTRFNYFYFFFAVARFAKFLLYACERACMTFLIRLKRHKLKISIFHKPVVYCFCTNKITLNRNSTWVYMCHNIDEEVLVCNWNKFKELFLIICLTIAAISKLKKIWLKSYTDDLYWTYLFLSFFGYCNLHVTFSII